MALALPGANAKSGKAALTQQKPSAGMGMEGFSLEALFGSVGS